MPDFRNTTLKQLRAFQTYVKTGTISAAADVLHVTPPAVTIQIKSLEEIVGASLYDRRNGRIEVSDSGQAVLRVARIVEQSLLACNEELETLRYARAGRVRVGIVSTATYFMPKAIAGFRRYNPDVDISLQVGNRQWIVEQLKDRLIDFAITGRPPAAFSEGASRLCDHPYVVVGLPGHRLATKRNIPLSEFFEDPFLVREEGSGSRALMESVFAERAFQPNRFGMVTDSNEAIKQGILAGLGVAFLSAHTIVDEVNAGKISCFEVEGFPITRAWFLVNNGSSSLSPAAAVFQRFLEDRNAEFLPDMDFVR